MKTFAQFVNEMSAPVRHTCPDINDIQSTLFEIENNMYNYSSNIEDEDIASFLSSASHEIKSIRERSLEYLRECNSSLRDWGYEMEAKVDSLNKEISQADQKINTLENDIDYLTREISRLESLLA